MKFITVAALAASICTAFAGVLDLDKLKAPKGHHWVAPGPNDSRGPCPALNSLANHGFLPHSGKGITIADYVKANKDGLNTGPSFSFPQGNLALQSNCTTATQMSLEQLRRHNKFIEHDASLAHGDAGFHGPDFVRNKRAINMFFGAFGNKKYTTLQSASYAKFQRVNDSLTNNPTVKYGPRELLFSYIETALYLQTMGRSLTSGVAEIEYIKTLFIEERLPYAEGWTPGPTVNEGSLGMMAVLLQPLGPQPGDEYIYEVNAGAIQEIIEGKSDLLFESKAIACPAASMPSNSTRKA